MQINDVSTFANEIRVNIEKTIAGKSAEINLVLSALFAEGHVLLEDVPGTGKTMLAKTLAKSFGCEFGRVQFTPDLLPSDLTGLNIYNPKTGDFNFRRGALFTNILLADEINRATPRTQSGLLESMEEKQITVDGETFSLDAPYFVIATQNPVETQGTFPLPEAQLDRFMVKLSLGYPSDSEFVNILNRFGNKENPLDKIKPVCEKDKLIGISKAVKEVFIHEELLTYIAELTKKTRLHEAVSLGVSVRGGLALMNIAKAYAALHGRGYAIPDDVQFLMPYVYSHRIIYKGGSRHGTEHVASLLQEIIQNTRVPTEDWGK